MNNLKICIPKHLNSDELRLKSAAHAVAQNSINMPDGSFRHPMTLALETTKIWPNGHVLKVGFLEGSAIQKQKVELNAKLITQYANLVFEFVEDASTADIRVSFDTTQGSWSNIGSDCAFVPKDQATMNYGWLLDDTDDAEYKRVVLHCFMHAIGAIDEILSPAAANLALNKEVIYNFYTNPPYNWSRADVDVTYFNLYNQNTTQNSEFDLNSIMLFPIPKEWTVNQSFSVGWNSDLSDTDKEFLAKYYPSSQIPLIVDGPVVAGSMPDNDTVTTFNTLISVTGGYQFTVAPSSAWVSVWSSATNLGYGKGTVKVVLDPGMARIRVRHSKTSDFGFFSINCKSL